jgi:hypothetical protein
MNRGKTGRASRQPVIAGAALLLLASAGLSGAVAFAQRGQPDLPLSMTAPALRDPAPRAGNSQADPTADGAVGDLIASVPQVPRPRPSQTEIDGKVGDLISTVPNVPTTRPSQPRADASAGDLLAYVPSRPTPRPPETGAAMAAAPGAARQSPMQMTQAERQCRARLTATGAAFREHDRLTDPSGCLVPFPIVLTSLGEGIELEPEAVLNCAAALSLVDYAHDTVSPEAEKAFGSALETVNHASAYVCRGRVGTGESKLSEHAFGNAIDIGSFELEDGRRLDVRAYGPGEIATRNFMRDVRGAACGPWKTVLGPGTNADHATHFHLDLAQRRRGGTYCK